MKHITETEAILVEEGNLRTPKDLCELAGFIMHEDFSVTPKTKPAFKEEVPSKNETTKGQPSAWKLSWESPARSHNRETSTIFFQSRSDRLLKAEDARAEGNSPSVDPLDGNESGVVLVIVHLKAN